MSAIVSLPSASAIIGSPAWLPRVSIYDGKAIEQAMAGSLLNPGVELAGALVEASFANGEPPLLRRVNRGQAG
jgi:hypothetical protein